MPGMTAAQECEIEHQAEARMPMNLKRHRPKTWAGLTVHGVPP